MLLCLRWLLSKHAIITTVINQPLLSYQTAFKTQELIKKHLTRQLVNTYHLINITDAEILWEQQTSMTAIILLSL